MAISSDIRAKYTATIGIECHVQFKTRTKLFSGADNDARTAAPNTLVNHIDFGLPGALPVLNEKAVEFAARAAFALQTTPQRFSKFDRKHYFYPDLPMGYQITQFYDPIIRDGYIDIVVAGGETKRIRIHEAHMEADAGKSTHPAGTDYSLVDLNRAGTPLLEIVSEPDIHSATEAKAYARELNLLMRYAEVSDANLYYGNMRFDVNVSVSKTDVLGKRTETKNLNSFKSVEKAAEYEIERQIGILESGGVIVQETRGFEDATGRTFSQRSKEDAHDYRYMPDPDIPPIVLGEEYVERIRAELPELPPSYRAKFADIGIDASTIEDIIAVPETTRTVAAVLEQSTAEDARRVAFWLLRPAADEDEAASVSESAHSVGASEKRAGEERADSERSDVIARGRGEAPAKTLERSTNNLIKLSQMTGSGKLSSSAAKEVLDEMLRTHQDPEEIAESRNLIQVSDENAITAIVVGILANPANDKAVADIKAGNDKAIGFLVGQVMKESKGKANPALATKLIRQQLEVS